MEENQASLIPPLRTEMGALGAAISSMHRQYLEELANSNKIP